MKSAMILAAGFGTRLKSLTQKRPKPMVEFRGKPLIFWTLDLLRRSGATQVVINTHYLGDQIIEYVEDGKRWDLKVSYSKEDPILDTGGGIKKVLIENPEISELVVVNSDVCFDLDFNLSDFFKEDLRENEIARFLLGKSELFARYGGFLVGEQRVKKLLLKGEGDRQDGEVFLGIHKLSRQLLEYMPQKEVFSITRDVYKEVLDNGSKDYISYQRYNGFWSDLGTIEELDKAKQYFANE